MPGHCLFTAHSYTRHQHPHVHSDARTYAQGMFGALIVINSFPSERMLALRERAAGTYHVSAYFLAKITAETISQLPAPIIFACIVYW